LLQMFGMPEAEAKKRFFKATTREEMRRVWKEPMVQSPDMPTVVEVVMDAFDAPWRMLSVIGARGPTVIKEMEEGGFVLRKPTVV